MSQSRFSIVLVGVSALLRRPLVSRFRPADGERSSWVVFTARGGRFDSELPPSASEIALGGLAFGLTASAFGTHRFGIALGGLSFGFTASAFRHALLRSGRWASSFFRLPLRKLPSAGWFFRWAGCPSGSPLPLFGTHRFGVAAGRVRSSAFRFGDCRWASWPSGSRLPLFGTHRFGVAAGRVGSSAFRFGDCPRRVGLRAHCFRFSACTVSEIAAGRVGLRTHCFRFSARAASEIAARRVGASARRVGASAFRFGDCCSAGWPSGSPLPLFGMRRSAPPCRRREDRRSTTTRQLFHFKTLIPTC